MSVWAVALLTLPGLYLLAIGVNSATGGEAPPFDAFRADQHLIPVFLLFNLLPIFGPVGEELGWRGFALPRLAGPAGPVLASIVIGVVWGIWQLPDFFADEGVLGIPTRQASTPSAKKCTRCALDPSWVNLTRLMGGAVTGNLRHKHS